MSVREMDGGPAFHCDYAAPAPVSTAALGAGPMYVKATSAGMSLRDYFAAKALPAVVNAYIAANGSCIGADHTPRNCAAHAYRYADAMLKAREAEA